MTALSSTQLTQLRTALGDLAQPATAYPTAQLDQAFHSILGQIQQWCDRNLIGTSYSELYDIPTTFGELILLQPDVTAVTLVSMSTESGLTAAYSGSDTHARVEVTDAAVVLTSRVGATTTTNSLTFASNVTTTAMATAVTAVSGWTGDLQNDGPSAFLVRKGVQDAKDGPVWLPAWDDFGGEYVTDYPAGILRFGSFDGFTSGFISGNSGRMRVDYDAGAFLTSDSVPDDLEFVMVEMAKEAADRAAHDAGVESERLGDYAYKIAAPTEIADRYQVILSKYKRWAA